MYEAEKLELCCGARILYRAGQGSLYSAGHMSMKVSPDRMLANSFGPSFETVEPSDILTLDFEGNIIDGRGIVNDTIRLHGEVHKYNPDTIVLVHTHPWSVITVSALRVVPEIYDQESCVVAGAVALLDEDYDGLDSTDLRVRPIANAMSDPRVTALILPNHGALTRGAGVREAVLAMMSLENLCARYLDVHAAARATGHPPKAIDPQIALDTRREQLAMKAGALIWNELASRLRKTDPEFATTYFRSRLSG